MKRGLVLLGAALLGLGAGEYLVRDFDFRSWLGALVRRGDLQKLVGTRGIYDRDSQWTGEPLERLEARARLTNAAAGQAVSAAAIEREMTLLRAQFPDEKTWSAALERAGVSARALRREVTTHLRDRLWLEAQVSGQILPNETAARQFYAAHRELFRQPARFRADHLFLAAPDGYPDELIESKRTLGNELALRLRNGESFSGLVAQFSEDEATRHRDGDLNYFSEKRMLPEVFAAAQALRVGEMSAPIRSRLGFHLLRLTAAEPARQMTYEEASPEITLALENESRAALAESFTR